MSTNDFDGQYDDQYDDRFDQDDELRGLLRGGDPARALPPADPAALASLLGDIMSADLDIRPAESAELPRRRTPTTWLVAAAAVAAIAAGGAFAVTGLTGEDPGAPQAQRPATTTPKANAGIAGQTTALKAGSAAGRCAVLTPAILGQFDQAFAGTVTAVEGDTVTFQTTEVYQGEVGETVTLKAPPAGITKILGGAPAFQVGQSYLVPAYQGAVSMCGYSGPAADGLEQVYQEAFVH
jgi:hypothetical protein